MKLKVYHYEKCDTCRKAKKFLADHAVSVAWIPIREHPPSVAELKRMLQVYGGDRKRLFNTAGQDYRAMNMKEKLPGMSDAQALELLAAHGNLVKRPFAIGAGGGCVGFKEEEWNRLLP
jgi:arsenate reductase